MIMDVTSTFLQPDFGSFIALNRLCVVSIILYLLSRVNLNELGHLKYQNELMEIAVDTLVRLISSLQLHAVPLHVRPVRHHFLFSPVSFSTCELPHPTIISSSLLFTVLVQSMKHLSPQIIPSNDKYFKRTCSDRSPHVVNLSKGFRGLYLPIRLEKKKCFLWKCCFGIDCTVNSGCVSCKKALVCLFQCILK